MFRCDKYLLLTLRLATCLAFREALAISFHSTTLVIKSLLSSTTKLQTAENIFSNFSRVEIPILK